MLKKIAVLLVILGFSFALMLLTTDDSHFEAQSHANFPVTQEEVWQRLIKVDGWSDWWPGMQEARLVGALTAGGEIHLRLQGMPTEDPALLTRVNSPSELAWEGSGVFGSRAGTRFLVESDAGGSRVTIENFVRGPQAFLARFTGKEAFVKYQQKLLKRLGLSLQGELSDAGEKD